MKAVYEIGPTRAVLRIGELEVSLALLDTGWCEELPYVAGYTDPLADRHATPEELRTVLTNQLSVRAAVTRRALSTYTQRVAELRRILAETEATRDDYVLSVAEYTRALRALGKEKKHGQH